MSSLASGLVEISALDKTTAVSTVTGDC